MLGLPNSKSHLTKNHRNNQYIFGYSQEGTGQQISARFLFIYFLSPSKCPTDAHPPTQPFICSFTHQFHHSLVFLSPKGKEI